MELTKNKLSETKLTIDQLGRFALFFAKRSYEYLKVPKSEKRRPDILGLQNLRFFKNGRMLSHNNTQLEFPDCISKTLKQQKEEEINDTVTRMESRDTILCLVCINTALMR